MPIEFGVDIGHGQNTFPDTGSKGVIADGTKYAEHSFNAQVGTKVKSILEAHGAIVHMAQQPYADDVSLTARTNFYNSKPNIKLIASIHANAGPATARGMCAFYWHTSANSKRAADLYAKYVSAFGHILYSGGTEPSVPGTWTDFHMCRETNAPTILTENSFMTNSEDFKLVFQSQEYIQETAEIIARSMLEYAGIAYIGDDVQPTSVQILTGGLVSSNAKLFIDFLMSQGDGWWGEIRIRKGVNPKGLTGGLDPEMRATTEAFLKSKGWGYTVWPKGEVPE